MLHFPLLIPHDSSPLTPTPLPSTINTGWGLTPRGHPSRRIFRESTMAEEHAGTPSLSCMRNIYAIRPAFPKSEATSAAPIPSWPLSGNHGSLRPMRHILATKTLISATKVAAPRYEKAASTPRMPHPTDTKTRPQTQWVPHPNPFQARLSRKAPLL